MEIQGRTRALHVIATAVGQCAALKALLATWLLSTLLTISVGHTVLAADDDQSATDRRIKSHFERPHVTQAAQRQLSSLPGIQQPDFATPMGGVAAELDPDRVPAKEHRPANGGDKKTQHKEPRKVDPMVTAAAAPPATWSSLWHKVFASDSASPTVPSQPLPPGSSKETTAIEPFSSPVGDSERLASHTGRATDGLLDKTSKPQSAEASSAAPMEPAQQATEEPHTPRLFKLAETVVDSGNRSGVFGLSRQMAMRGDQPMVTESLSNGTPSPQTGDKRYALEDSSLLQPFKATNSASDRSPGAAGLAFGAASPNGYYSSPLGSLGGQLTMSTTTNYRTLAESVANSPMLSEQANEESGWTPAIPLITNPLFLTQSPAADGAQLAGFQEESLPAPPDPGGDDNPFTNDSRQTSEGESKTLADADKLGEEPEDNTLQFLRTQTVLLKPGESQCDIGINYLFSDVAFPVLLLDSGVPVGAENALFRIRELSIPLEYRVGLLKRVQAFVGAPIGWSNTQVSLGNYEQFQNDGGFGDLDFGATIQVVEGNAECPHGLFTVMATAPTGGDPFGPAPVLAQSAPSLGQGFWSIAANALCVQTYDPIVLFYGVGAEHFFSRHFNGREIEPGNAWNYTFGVGFAVNDRVTLSTRFLGSYFEEVRINRERRFGTNVEPMSIRMAATISKPCNRIVEPFVEFGVTESAIDSFFGITWTY